MPLLQIHVFKSTRMHHFEGQIAEAPIVGEGVAPSHTLPPLGRLRLPRQFTPFFSCFFISSFSSLYMEPRIVRSRQINQLLIIIHHWAAVVSCDWAKASGLQVSLSCAVLCQIVSLQYLSRSSHHHLVGFQVVTREVHRSPLRRLLCPAQDHLILSSL